MSVRITKFFINILLFISFAGAQGMYMPICVNPLPALKEEAVEMVKERVFSLYKTLCKHRLFLRNFFKKKLLGVTQEEK